MFTQECNIYTLQMCLHEQDLYLYVSGMLSYGKIFYRNILSAIFCIRIWSKENLWKNAFKEFDFGLPNRYLENCSREKLLPG